MKLNGKFRLLKNLLAGCEIDLKKNLKKMKNPKHSVLTEKKVGLNTIQDKEFKIIGKVAENTRYKNTSNPRNVKTIPKGAAYDKSQINKTKISNALENFDTKLDKYFMAVKQEEKNSKPQTFKNQENHLAHICDPCKRLSYISNQAKHLRAQEPT